MDQQPADLQIKFDAVRGRFLSPAVQTSDRGRFFIGALRALTAQPANALRPRSRAVPNRCRL